MNMTVKSGAVLVLAIVLIAGIAIGVSLNGPVFAQAEKAAAGPQYTVVETEGTHLIVTDNQKNVTYFYTVDQGEKPGSPLQLRGTVDLKDVGKATIKPTLLNPKK